MENDGRRSDAVNVLDAFRTFVSRRPAWVVMTWLALAAGIACFSPNLSRLAAESQASMLSADAESVRAAALINQSWPKQAYNSMAVAVLHRAGGLTEADTQYALRLSQRFQGPGKPAQVTGVLGPASESEIAERLKSHDKTVTLLAVMLSSSFVAPVSHDVVAWMERQAQDPELAAPAGLELRWTGDAIIGRDYMANVQTSLDRAAVATVVLLLVVLLAVYRSFWLALVPLATIGASLLISRGVLAWMMLAGWELSPLVELFLIAILFGTGTDFCLFLSWRYAEHLNPSNPVGSMQVTLGRSFSALVTSAGTIIIGLLLMGTTKFKLFSSTGPSVAISLAIALVATLTLTPALLVILARLRPRAFEGLAGTSREFWDRLGRAAMARPLRSWTFTVLAMVPLSILGLRTHFVQDLLSELPETTASARDFRLVSSKFDPGMLAPLTVVLESDTNLRSSEGLALIDDVSRLLSHQRKLSEVRSATQPLGSPKLLERARLASRLGEVNNGFHQLSDGAELLQKGLTEGAAKLRAAIWLEETTGLTLTGTPVATKDRKSDAAVNRAHSRETLASGLKQASAVLHWNPGMPATWNLSALSRAIDAVKDEKKDAGTRPATARFKPSETTGGPPGKTVQVPASTAGIKPAVEKPQETLLRELTRAALGAAQIADGALRANREVAAILNDPVGRRALDHLLIDERTVRDNPDLLRSFAAYITPDGHRARIDLTQADRMFSHDSMDQVLTLRRRLSDFLGEYQGIHVTAKIAGSNAESADVRILTHNDQVQSWFIVPIGVFLVLIFALRDPLACVNLVATMVLTYAFALGATHLVFVTLLGGEGIDWKVPYFLFVLLIAVGVDYNVFLMTRLNEESQRRGLRNGIVRAIGQTGGLISSAAIITASSFASFLLSPLSSLRQLGFALVVGILVDAVLVRPLLVPCGHWLLRRTREVLLPHRVIHKGTREYAIVPD
jgi:putative drug exporter of the RND superfamily